MRTRLRETACAAAVLALVASGIACDRPEAYTGKARHLVMISLDTTRADHFGFYGNPTVRTPHLDALALESVVLDDFQTVVPTTLAAHTTLFTGKYPHHHGIARNGFRVNDDNVMLAELLAPYGFTSAAFAASFALEEQFHLYQGFDHFSANFERWSESGEVMQNERRAEAVTDDVIGYLDETGVPEHLFLFVHYFDAHAPYEAPAPYDTLYDARGREGIPAGMAGWRAVMQPCNRLGGARTAGADRQAKQYAGEISYMDHQIGRLLSDLDARGILDEALVVVTSDHGEVHWGHVTTVSGPVTYAAGCFDHGWNTYEAEVRAVGAIRLPGGRHGGTRLDAPLSSIDVMPTVARYLGLDAPGGVDGHAFDLDALDDLPAADRVRYSQATKPPNDAFESDPRWRNMLKPRSATKGPYKLIQVPIAGTEELYDLEADPFELSNLLETPTKEVTTIAADLRRSLEGWAAKADPLPSVYLVSKDCETCLRLKELGYVEECPEECR